MYIPDLFGAYIKGRELAIEKNWQDLKNYETVQNARLQNDLTALDLLGRRTDFAGNRAMHNYQVNSASRADRIGEIAQPGMEAKANMGSDVAVGQYGVYKAYEPQYIQALGDMFGAKIGEQSNAAQALLGKNAYLAPHAYQIGQDQGYIGHQQVLANKTTAGNLVNAANQQIAISNGNAANATAGNRLQGIQIDNAISNQPLIQANTADALGRVIPARNATQAQIGAANTGKPTAEQIGSMYALALGDPAAQGVYMLEQAGQVPAGTFQSQFGAKLGMTQDLMGAGGQTATPAQATPATGQTQSGVPVGTNSVLAPTGTPQTNQPVQDIRSLLPPMFQNPNGGQVYNYPVSPEHGQYRSLVPTPTPQEVQQQQLINRLSGPQQGGIL